MPKVESNSVCPHPGCTKVFKRKGDLTRHQLLHYGEKSHQCSFCLKGFFQASGLKTHLNVHTKDKPYACGVGGCTRHFGDPSSCTRHRKETHRVRSSRPCPQPGCRSRIKRPSTFNKHLREKHGLDPNDYPADIEPASGAASTIASTSSSRSSPADFDDFEQRMYYPRRYNAPLYLDPLPQSFQTPHNPYDFNNYGHSYDGAPVLLAPESFLDHPGLYTAMSSPYSSSRSATSSPTPPTLRTTTPFNQEVKSEGTVPLKPSPLRRNNDDDSFLSSFLSNSDSGYSSAESPHYGSSPNDAYSSLHASWA